MEKDRPDGGFRVAWLLRVLLARPGVRTSSRMFELIRWTTVHPALVHLPLGISALAVVVFLWAAARRSERLTFVADIALYGAAAGVLLAAPFGLVSYFVLEWPGGVAPWPALHLAFGVASTVLVLGFATYRWIRRRRPGGETAGWGSALAMLGIGAVLLFTGYVGGEMLVFHHGIAVSGGAHGALAPSASWPEEPPADLSDAMGRLRGAYARAQTELSRSLVEAPTPRRFEEIADAAAHIAETAQWIAQRDGGDEKQGAGVGGAGHDGAQQGGSGHGGEDHGSEGTSGEHHHGGEHLAQEAKKLLQEAQTLRDAAQARDITKVTRALGNVEQTCAHCHAELRWKGQHGN